MIEKIKLKYKILENMDVKINSKDYHSLVDYLGPSNVLKLEKLSKKYLQEVDNFFNLGDKKVISGKLEFKINDLNDLNDSDNVEE